MRRELAKLALESKTSPVKKKKKSFNFHRVLSFLTPSAITDVCVPDGSISSNHYSACFIDSSNPGIAKVWRRQPRAVHKWPLGGENDYLLLAL